MLQEAMTFKDLICVFVLFLMGICEDKEEHKLRVTPLNCNANISYFISNI